MFGIKYKNMNKKDIEKLKEVAMEKAILSLRNVMKFSNPKIQLLLSWIFGFSGSCFRTPSFFCVSLSQRMPLGKNSLTKL